MKVDLLSAYFNGLNKQLHEAVQAFIYLSDLSAEERSEVLSNAKSFEEQFEADSQSEQTMSDLLLLCKWQYYSLIMPYDLDYGREFWGLTCRYDKDAFLHRLFPPEEEGTPFEHAYEERGFEAFIDSCKQELENSWSFYRSVSQVDLSSFTRHPSVL